MANATMVKFGYPDTLIKEFGHWAVLLRQAQVTLGSLILAAKGEATAYSDLPDEAFGEQAVAVRAIEKALQSFCQFERINYLMLMMVDPNVHFHVIPRYSRPRRWGGIDFPDVGWPGPPQLAGAVSLDAAAIARMATELKANFR
jgi:diadenosine tetraphosphate (Ap4A) HIT family hydrolase